MIRTIQQATSSKHYVSKMEKQTASRETPVVVGPNEMDTLADTSYAGRNWTVVEYTGKACDVYGFTKDGEPQKGIPIATCATVVVDPKTGQDVMLIGHEMLYFGEKLDRTLLNQNQLRYAGIKVKDDPTVAGNEGFGIFLDDIIIPFKMKGITVYFDSRNPTDRELETFPAIQITEESPWDPQNVNLLRQVAQVKPQDGPCYSHESDRALASISTCFDIGQSDLSHRLVGFTSTRDTRHTVVTAEGLCKTLNLGLETARNTLRMTTQHGARTAVRPITRRYRVDHLALNRRRLGGQFYTDALRGPVKSLNGNQYAQVFTNGRYTAVVPIKQKGDAGKALNQIIDDVGVPDKLRADLAGEQYGDSTEFMRLVRRYRIDQTWAEQGRHNQNAVVEREIGIFEAKVAPTSVPQEYTTQTMGLWHSLRS